MRTQPLTSLTRGTFAALRICACWMLLTNATTAAPAPDWAAVAGAKMDAVINHGGVPRFTLQHVVRGPGWDYKELAEMPGAPAGLGAARSGARVITFLVKKGLLPPERAQ